MITNLGKAKNAGMNTEQIAQEMDDNDPMIASLSQIAALAEEAQDPYQRGWLMGVFQFRQMQAILLKAIA